MSEVRCPAVVSDRDGFMRVCGAKLAEGLDGRLDIKCRRCKTLITIDRVDNTKTAV
jgi:phage FluMu protein Com